MDTTRLDSGEPGPALTTTAAANDPTGIHAWNVVVGIDGSPAGWSALDWAAREAAVRGGDLVLCTVIPTGTRPRAAARESRSCGA